MMRTTDRSRLLHTRSLAFMVERLISRRTTLGLLGASAVAHVVGCGSASPTPPTPAATSDAVHYLTLVDIGRRIASRDVSPVDLTESHAQPLPERFWAAASNSSLNRANPPNVFVITCASLP